MGRNRVAITIVSEARELLDEYNYKGMASGLKSLVIGNSIMYALTDSYCQVWLQVLTGQIDLCALIRWRINNPDDPCTPTGLRSGNEDGEDLATSVTFPVGSTDCFGIYWAKLSASRKGQLLNICLVRYFCSPAGRLILQSVSGQACAELPDDREVMKWQGRKQKDKKTVSAGNGEVQPLPRQYPPGWQEAVQL